MTDLEKLASGLFTRYCQWKEGRSPDWNYLSKDRQIEWEKEVIMNIDYVVEYIRSNIKAPPATIVGEASYGLGFKGGMQVKHTEIITILESLKAKLKQQLNNIINPPKD